MAQRQGFESIKINTQLLDVLREWSAATNKTLAGLIAEILWPAAMAYLQGKRAAEQGKERDTLLEIVGEAPGPVA